MKYVFTYCTVLAQFSLITVNDRRLSEIYTFQTIRAIHLERNKCIVADKKINLNWSSSLVKHWLFTLLNIAFLGWGINGLNLVNVSWLMSVIEWYTSQVLFIPPLWLMYTYVLTSYTVTVLVAVLVVHLLSLFLSTHFCYFVLSLFVLPLLVDSVHYTCVHVVFLWCVYFKMSCAMNGWMRCRK